MTTYVYFMYLIGSTYSNGTINDGTRNLERLFVKGASKHIQWTKALHKSISNNK